MTYFRFQRSTARLSFEPLDYRVLTNALETLISVAMSFGFSVGDFLAGATLAYTLGKALSDSQGSVHEYKELIAELNVVNKVLIHVEQLRATNQLAQSTVNALLFAVNASNEAIESFLHRQQAYIESFRDGGSGNIIKDVYRKGKWATVAPEHVIILPAKLSGEPR